MKILCECTLGLIFLMVTALIHINTMSPVKRPLCYPRKPFTGGTPAPAKKPVHSGEGHLSKLLGRISFETKIVDNSWRPIFPEKPAKIEEPVLSNIIDADHPLAKVNSRDISDEETINIYAAAGYSPTFLDELRVKFKTKHEVADENDAYLDKVLANYPGKSTTRPKKTKLRTRLATMSRNRNQIKLEDLEDDKVKENDGENNKKGGR